MNTTYFCYCGKCCVEGVWTNQSNKLWGYLRKQVAKERIEIRIAPHICPDCHKLWEKGKRRPKNNIII